MTSYVAPRDRRDFEVAIICALPLEADAVIHLLDQDWEDAGKEYGKATHGDPNAYTTGSIGKHNVVVAHMPGKGKVSAASVAAGLRVSFVNIKLALVVGVCGGVPTGPHHENGIFLGDVIISQSVMQYDLGRQHPHMFERKNTLEDSLGRPPLEIRSVLAKLKTEYHRGRMQESANRFLHDLQGRLPRSRYPGVKDDKLFALSYRHKHRDSTVCSICGSPDDAQICDEALDMACDVLGCEEDQLIRRDREIPGTQRSVVTTNAVPPPSIYIGKIGSGDSVIRSASHRDLIAVRDGIIGFEMEGAGVWDYFPSVVIKGVCDYADSHKSKRWQDYAAATAAACAKSFLKAWKPGSEVIEDEVAGKAKPGGVNFISYGKLQNQSAEQTFHRPVTYTANSSFMTERPAENRKVERETPSTGAQAPEDDNHAPFKKRPQSPNMQPGHLQTTVSLDRTLNQTLGADEATNHFVKREPTINAMAGSFKQTPLYSAAGNGHDTLIQLLLDNGADIHAKNVGDGFMALHIATQGGHEEAVRVLLAMGADVNAKADNGWTALHLAAQNGHAGTARLLLTRGPDVNVMAGRTKQTPLFSAAGNGHDSLIQLLLDNGADIHAKNVGDGFMALHIATQGGHEKVVQALLAMGADINAKTTGGFTALHLAAQNGHIKIARLLLTKRPDVNAMAGGSKQTPLYSAATQGHDNLVQLLLDNGADIHVRSVIDGFMALHIAAQGGHEKVVQVLLVMGAQVDAEAKDGWTALHIAAQNGHAGTAQLLLTKGPDFNITASNIEQILS